MLTTIDNGSPRASNRLEVPAAADFFFYNAGWADKLGTEAIETWDGPRALDYATVKPFGVVAVIMTWNGPLYAAAMTLAPALAAGNTVVLKPAETAPFTVFRIGQLCLEAGIPEGVVNVVPSGPHGGEALCSHPGVDKIHFTGGGLTAQKVLRTAAANLTPVALELGGKSANLIFDDADPEVAAHLAITGAVNLTGQGCINGTRILVHDSLYEQVLSKSVTLLAEVRIGDPILDSTVIGPVISEQACSRILGFVERARATSAGQLVHGGKRLLGDLSNGFFVEPTVFSDVNNESELAQTEIFGPVLSFTRFHSEEDAIRIANDSPYGLAAYICTEDLRRAHRVADLLEVGNVWVNEIGGPLASVPFGGMKRSGFGRLGGREGVREFSQPKNVRIPIHSHRRLD